MDIKNVLVNKYGGSCDEGWMFVLVIKCDVILAVISFGRRYMDERKMC